MKENHRHSTILHLAIIFLSLIACSRSPQPIDYGLDGCQYCRMVIVDQRYGAELITEKGKVNKFDSVECLAASYIEAAAKGIEVHSLWVTNHATPGRFIVADTAIYLHSPELKSPMGVNLTAFATTADAEMIRNQHGGDLLEWSEVKGLVGSEWELSDHKERNH